jgi:ABC-2 type transport system permease protein
MKTVKVSLIERLRITWVIAHKDLREAIKNKNTLTVIASALFIVVLYRLLPGLSSSAHAPELIVYDPGASQIVAQVEDGSAFLMLSFPNQESMKQRVAASETPYLGLDIPANFDELAAAGQAQELQGYVIYWASAQKVAQIRQAAEAELTRLAGAPVRIKPELTAIYPSPENNTLGNWAALTLVFALMMISIQLIPNLMLEEKNSHTLDALLVSPASPWELAAGKAIAGLIYSLLASAVIVVVFYASLLHFVPILLAIVLGGLFMAFVGLWTGLKVESRGQLSIFVIGLMTVLLIPAVAYMISDLFTANLGQVLRWLPGTLVYRLAQAAFGQQLRWDIVLLDAIALLAWTVLVGAGLVLQIQRLDRSPFWKGSTLPGRHSNGAAAGESGSVVLPIAQEIPGEVQFAWKSAETVSGKPQSLRILGFIAAKDLREALHNKIVVAILLTSLLMVLLNSSIPLLLKIRPSSMILVVDEGNSSVLNELKANIAITIRQAGNQQKMEEALANSMQDSLGLALPADFDQRLATGETVSLAGFASHWVDRVKLAEILAALNGELSRISTGQVALEPQIQRIYPGEGLSAGQPFMIGLITVFQLLVMGIALTPVLFVEEKETHTLEALLASPARPAQIVGGKAVVGVVYGLLASAVVVSLNSYLFVRWDIVVLALFASLAFSVALGLLIGVHCENPATLGIWGGMLMLLLTATTLASAFRSEAYPAWLSGVLRWLPGNAMLQLLSAGMRPAPDLWNVVMFASLLLVLAALLLGLTIRKVRSWR